MEEGRRQPGLGRGGQAWLCSPLAWPCQEQRPLEVWHSPLRGCQAPFLTHATPSSCPNSSHTGAHRARRLQPIVPGKGRSARIHHTGWRFLKARLQGLVPSTPSPSSCSFPLPPLPVSALGLAGILGARSELVSQRLGKDVRMHVHTRVCMPGHVCVHVCLCTHV